MNERARNERFILRERRRCGPPGAAVRHPALWPMSGFNLWQAQQYQSVPVPVQFDEMPAAALVYGIFNNLSPWAVMRGLVLRDDRETG